MPYLDNIRGNRRLWNVPWNVVDFETTRGAPQEPIEIAIVPIRGGEIDYDGIYCSLLWPLAIQPWRLWPHVPISPDMLENAPTVDQVRRDVRRLLIGAVFIQHAIGKNPGCGCDARLAARFFKVNWDRAYCFSTITLGKLLKPNARIGQSLDALCRRYQVSNSQPHRALPD